MTGNAIAGKRRDSRPQQRPRLESRDKEQLGAVELGGMCGGETTFRAEPSQRCH